MSRGSSGRASRLAGLAGGVAASLAAAGAAWAVREVPAAIGALPSGARAERMRRSPQFRDGKFRNPVPGRTLPPGSARKTLLEMMRGEQRRTPSLPIPLRTPTGGSVHDGLRITWYGHASTLVELEGRRLLLDPLWSERCSPSRLVGPRRLHPPPVALNEVPELDAIVISHDHYDHLDMPTVLALAQDQSAPFFVPLGVGAHLDRWGVPSARIVELDWDESATVSGIRLTATAARHFSGRGLRRDDTLWSSWVIAGASRRVFYTGDTGYFGAFKQIGAEHGPFDASLIQIGAYGDAWPDIHMTPEDAVSAHVDVGGGLLIPVHWCTYVLSLHAWSEPADRLWREAKAREVALAVPRPGERIDVDHAPEVDGWWQTIA
jgi:L-ascorbate metabolism protein UlaG (beta-lactamase superfamily)